MRMSCNGCRVLRKRCGENCSIRPCLVWIKSPESQANATVFLAKFYGRAGFVNLINSGPENLRPAIFKSLIYDACGRIVNPIYGSVGLLLSGRWHLCQEVVDAVLRGVPITSAASETTSAAYQHPLKSLDVRHVSKKKPASLFHVAKPIDQKSSLTAPSRSSSPESTTSLQSELAIADCDTKESPSGSETTIDDKLSGSGHGSAGFDIGLGLTLGLGPPTIGLDILSSEAELPACLTGELDINDVAPMKKRTRSHVDTDDSGLKLGLFI